MSDKISLDPKQLTMRDLKRARAGPLEGRDPYDLFEDNLESRVLVIWCLRSRDDPEFTWEDAQDVPMSEIAMRGDEDSDQPPPTGSSDEGGEPDAKPTRRGSAAKRPAPEPSTGSAPSSASTMTSSSG